MNVGNFSYLQALKINKRENKQHNEKRNSKIF